MNYRNYKGQYQTKKQYEDRILRRFYTYLTLLGVMIVVGIIAETNTVEYIAPHAEAHQDVVVPDWNLCDLHTVICEQEEPVQKAIQAVSEALGHDVTDETKKRINYLYERATAHSVSFDRLMHVAWCESMFYSKQSQLTYDFTDARLGIYKGQQERSFGIFQLSVPHHNITPEQAMDGKFSIDYAIEIVKSTGFRAWYGYSEDTDTCASGVAEYWL